MKSHKLELQITTITHGSFSTCGMSYMLRVAFLPWLTAMLQLIQSRFSGYSHATSKTQ